MWLLYIKNMYSLYTDKQVVCKNVCAVYKSICAPYYEIYAYVLYITCMFRETTVLYIYIYIYINICALHNNVCAVHNKSTCESGQQYRLPMPQSRPSQTLPLHISCLFPQHIWYYVTPAVETGLLNILRINRQIRQLWEVNDTTTSRYSKPGLLTECVRARACVCVISIGNWGSRIICGAEEVNVPNTRRVDGIPGSGG
jgi:hypothetical protein